MSKIQLGVSLFCFTGEYTSGQWSLEDCMAAVAALGAQRFEIVGGQMVRGYPQATDAFVGQFRDLCAKHGVAPLSYGANMDRGMRPDRDLTEDEMLQRSFADIRAARRLGCGYMRVQYVVPAAVLGRLAPYAEDYDVRLGVEIHNPETPSSPTMQRYLEVFERVGSHHLGFVPDFGSFAVRPNKPSMDMALAMGASQRALDYAVQCCYDKVPREQARAGLQRMGAEPAALGAFEDMYAFLTFYRQPDYAGLKAILPWVQYCHGKFHYMHEDLIEASIPYTDLFVLLDGAGYDGFVVSEYEGHGNTMEQMRRQLAMERALLAK